MPLVSIITVVFNDRENILSTIESITNQTYSNTELIIIDGNSTDGTREIIRKNDQKIDYWISEPDNGVFDGMNKGIKAAKGKWINFMNSGDSFKDREVLSKINFDKYSDKAIIYGNTTTQRGIEYPYVFNDQMTHMIACHQSMFFNKDILGSNLQYDLSLPLLSDIDLFIKVIRKGYSIEWVNQTVANYQGGGLSSQRTWKSFKSRLIFIHRHTGILGILSYIFKRMGLMKNDHYPRIELKNN